MAKTNAKDKETKTTKTITIGKPNEKAANMPVIDKGVWFGQRVDIVGEEDNYYLIRRPEGIVSKVLKLRVKTTPPTSTAKKIGSGKRKGPVGEPKLEKWSKKIRY